MGSLKNNTQNSPAQLPGENQAQQQTHITVSKNDLARLATNAERLYFTQPAHKDRLWWKSLAASARHLIVKDDGYETSVEVDVFNALAKLQ